jgi:hypothetical protein
MEQRKITSITDMKTGRIDDAMKRYSLGRNTMREVGKAAKAEIRIGKAVLYNFRKIDEYMESLSQ